MPIALTTDLETGEKVLCIHGARSQSRKQPVSRNLCNNRSLTSARSARVGRGRVAHVDQQAGGGPWKQGVYSVTLYDKAAFVGFKQRVFDSLKSCGTRRVADTWAHSDRIIQL